MAECNYSMSNTVASLKQCQRALENSEVYQQMPSSLRFVTELILDELASNTIKYGGPGRHTIDMRVHFDGEELLVTLEDDGLPFNPWEAAPMGDLETENIQDLAIGGRGIHMLRQATDERRYEYTNGKNVITLSRLVRRPLANAA